MCIRDSITVEVVDEEGTVVKLGDNEITCTVEGPARLLGLDVYKRQVLRFRRTECLGRYTGESMAWRGYRQ